ncbi:MAG: hypothetical protein A3B30_03195 [Candidatus Komeilibacteria bacterium RIFCSPLOWO2_01_FULL_52_15]|uniref:CDP-diacylglycerol--glycerol-3-phosphate 3-phosphatidyltransferase n=2 Tax=Candidatus Komeiliibacteriota TaxID=1817908 RepID=A0A1G2BQI1_9BACT|nr:MAG: hypothetical protein A3B30_03195 [Candidatus Komeilibacteria bacterium RIFCSPLOWO2_01_FULL_52_15]
MKRLLQILIVSAITLIRVPAAIASAYCMLHQAWFGAWILFMVSVATDVVDGQLARRWNVVTQFGVAADLYSDIAIYWVFVPSAYWYSQKYNLWWQAHLPPGDLVWILMLAATLFIFWWVCTQTGKHFVAWYIAKGNFWFGVIPVAAVGLWMAWHTHPAAVALTIFYGISALWINRDKIATKL